MGREMASHIYYEHGGDIITPVHDLDPDGSFGLEIIDRMLKFCDDFEKLLNKKPPYKAKFREPYLLMREDCIVDTQAISLRAWEKSWGNSSESAGGA